MNPTPANARRANWKELGLSFDAALEKLPEALKKEGFGVITQVDMKATLKEKLGVDFRRYRIIGACNPKFAHEAVTADPQVGILLPCNVVLYERDDGKTMLGIIDPVEQLGGDGGDMANVARAVRDRLANVLAAM